MIEEIREVIGRLVFFRKLDEFRYQSKIIWDTNFPRIILGVVVLCTLANLFLFDYDPFLQGIVWGLIIASLVYNIVNLLFQIKMGKWTDRVFKRLKGIKVKVLESGEVREI